MKLGKTIGAGMVVWCVGCGTAEYEARSEQASEPIQTSQQALTSSWAALTANKNCKFGYTAAPYYHQNATNTQASGRIEETLTLSGLAGRRITALQLRRPAGSTATFSYDDVMLINYKDSLLMASDKRLAGYLAGISADSITSNAVYYDWFKLKSKAIDNQTAEVAWCAVGNTSCSVPPTENTDPNLSLNVNMPSFQSMDALTYLGLPDSRTFTLVTVGDNDDGTVNSGYQTQDTDCTHGKIDVEIILSSTPVSTCSWEVKLDETASKFDDTGWLGSSDPLGTLLGGSTYNVQYNYSTGGYTTTGYNETQGANFTATYSNAVINNNELSLWGAAFTVKGNEVYHSQYGLVGHIKSTGCN